MKSDFCFLMHFRLLFKGVISPINNRSYFTSSRLPVEKILFEWFALVFVLSYVTLLLVLLGNDNEND